MVAGATSHLLTDALGSPIAVTDSIGVVQTEYTYEPFGKTTANGATNSSSYQYTGRENDGTELYYYRNRYYHPKLQRFISEDPYLHPTYGTCPSAALVPTVKRFATVVGANPQNLNGYSYTLNSPVNFRDPLGLYVWRCPQPPPGCSFVGFDIVETPVPISYCMFDYFLGRIRCIPSFQLTCAYVRCYYHCQWPSGRKNRPVEEQLEMTGTCTEGGPA